MKTYIGTKIIAAEPGEHADGRDGYDVFYADGYQSWSPKDTFEANYREVTHHERQLIEQTDAEHQIMAITDEPASPPCRHNYGPYNAYHDGRQCRRCGDILPGQG